MNTELYKQILGLFIADVDSERRAWMHTPFSFRDKAGATNGMSMVMVPRFGDYEDQSSKVDKIYPLPYNCEKEISLQVLKDAIAKAPLLDDYDETVGECDACYGEGEVEFEFSHHRRDYTLDVECPVCEGEGKIVKKSDTPNGKKFPDTSKAIRVGDSVFSIERLNELVKTAGLIGANHIALVHQDGARSANLFTIADVEVLTMPVDNVNKEDVLAII